MKNINNQNIMRWILQPSSWISLSAAVVSVGTFFLVYGNPGELKVTPPTEVGLRLILCESNVCNLELLMPVVFTNTGAQRNLRHLITVFAEMRLGEGRTSMKFKWYSEWQFMGKLEFEKKYPDFAEPGVVDYIVYVNRATPFVIAGGESAAKLLKLKPQTFDTGVLKSFDLLIEVVTETGVSTGASHYICRQTITEKQFDWCERTPLGSVK